MASLIRSTFCASNTALLLAAFAANACPCCDKRTLSDATGLVAALSRLRALDVVDVFDTFDTFDALEAFDAFDALGAGAGGKPLLPLRLSLIFTA